MLVKYIVIHCSATRFDQPYSAERLEADHKARGFRCGGYHYYIERDGVITQMRHLDERGAHVYGHNHESIGICYEGGLNVQGEPCDTRSWQQRSSMRSLLVYLSALFPDALVVGHRDLSPDKNGDGHVDASEWTKACPCFDAQEAYARL